MIGRWKKSFIAAAIGSTCAGGVALAEMPSCGDPILEPFFRESIPGRFSEVKKAFDEFEDLAPKARSTFVQTFAVSLDAREFGSNPIKRECMAFVGVTFNEAALAKLSKEAIAEAQEYSSAKGALATKRIPEILAILRAGAESSRMRNYQIVHGADGLDYLLLPERVLIRK